MSIRICVLGAGAWGTAIAISFAKQGHQISLWVRDKTQAGLLQNTGCNQKYLPGFSFPPGSLQVTHDFNKALDHTDLIFIATPISGFRQTLLKLCEKHRQAPCFWLCKGIDLTTGETPNEIAQSIMPGAPYGVLSGPGFASEICQSKPTALTLACEQKTLAQEWAKTLSHQRMRIYPSDDVTGVVIGGALKNVLAIATGICDGLNLGPNARAALVTRGLAEITRFGVKMGAKKETFMGLSGIGDILLTCTTDLSRNRQVGLKLAEGKNLSDIITELGHVAEGVHTAFALIDSAKRFKIDLPIAHAVHALLKGETSPQEAVQRLMLRQPKPQE